MSFTIVPAADNATNDLSIDGAGTAFEALAEGVASNDGDGTRIELLTSSAYADVQLDSASGFSPTAELALAVWVVLRRGGIDVIDFVTGEILYPKLRVQVRYFDSGRVVDLGEIEARSKPGYATVVIPLENDVDPAVDGWDKIAIILSRTDPHSTRLFVTALEFRALDRVFDLESMAQCPHPMTDEVIGPSLLAEVQATTARVEESLAVSPFAWSQSRSPTVEECISV